MSDLQTTSRSNKQAGATRTLVYEAVPGRLDTPAIAFRTDTPLGAQEAPAVALVRVAVALHEDEVAALEAVLARHFGRPLRVQVQVEPSILGGVWAQVGDAVIDGSLQGRLEALRQHLRTQSRLMLSGNSLAQEQRPDAA